MDFNLKRKLIQEAQNHLINQPQDLLHEVTHHYRTWEIAQEVGLSITEKFNWDVLEVICWWHDVQLPECEIPKGKRIVNVTATYLKEKVDQKVRDVVFDSITNHEYGSKPNYIEGKILQDADKLDLLSPERIRLGIEAVENGLYSRKKAIEVFEMITEEWIPNLPNTFHFKESNNLYLKQLSSSAPFYKKFKEVLGL